MTVTIEIPDKYSSLGVRSGWNPTPLNKARIWLVAPPAEGKTTLVTSNPKALVLDLEDRAGDIINSRATYVHYPDMKGYLNLITELCKDKKAGKSYFDTIVIDTVDAFIDQSIPYLTEKYSSKCEDIREYAGGKGGWFKMRDLLMSNLQELTLAGYGWVVTSHVIDKELGEGNNKRIVRCPSVMDSVRKALNNTCHLIGTMVLKDHKVKVTKKMKYKTSSGEVKESKKEIEESQGIGFFLSFRKGTGINSPEIRDSKNSYYGLLNDYIKIPKINGWKKLEEEYELALIKAKETQNAKS